MGQSHKDEPGLDDLSPYTLSRHSPYNRYLYTHKSVGRRKRRNTLIQQGDIPDRHGYSNASPGSYGGFESSSRPRIASASSRSSLTRGGHFDCIKHRRRPVCVAVRTKGTRPSPGRQRWAHPFTFSLCRVPSSHSFFLLLSSHSQRVRGISCYFFFLNIFSILILGALFSTLQRPDFDLDVKSRG